MINLFQRQNDSMQIQSSTPHFAVLWTPRRFKVNEQSREKNYW